MQDGKVIALEFTKEEHESSSIDIPVITELKEYFSLERKEFSTEILFFGSPFERSVWKVLQKIPYGTTLSYSDVGEILGNKNLARAVGNACNKNPIAVIIPCHRVIPKGYGRVGKYAYGSEIKKALISMEGNNL